MYSVCNVDLTCLVSVIPAWHSLLGIDFVPFCSEERVGANTFGILRLFYVLCNRSVIIIIYCLAGSKFLGSLGTGVLLRSGNDNNCF